MAAGDSTLVAAQSLAQYKAQSNNLVGTAFSMKLDIAQSNANILSQLQGDAGTGVPFEIKTDLNKGAMDTVQFAVGTSLGQVGRRGTERAVNFEEPILANTWPVQIDSLRVVVGWNEIVAAVATTGQSWQEVYPDLVGQRVGQIEQEDMLSRMRQRSSALNTVRPNNRATLDALKFDDVVDTQTFGRAVNQLKSNGAAPAKIGKMSGGMDLKTYVALGPNIAFESLWTDPQYTNALSHAAIDGPMNPFWTGDLPMWRGTVLKSWDVVSHDNPGAIGSTVLPQALLGDPITSGTTAITIFGGGRTQASLGNSAAIYAPFEYFYGCDKRFGLSISTGADVGTYYFVVIDPADGFWNLYSYTGTGVLSNGNAITVSSRLAAGASGVAVTTLGNWTYDSTVNKVAFPTGSLIVQVNANVVPVCDSYLFGSKAGGKAYGKVRDKRISNMDDYGALNGVGVWSIYGQDMRKDTLGNYHRGFIRLQSAYEVAGFSLPQL